MSPPHSRNLKGNTQMAPRTFTIELRVDHDEPTEENDKVILDAVALSAKHLLATAMLLKGRRRPQVMVSNGDMMAINEEVDIRAAEAENFTGDEAPAEEVATEAPPAP